MIFLLNWLLTLCLSSVNGPPPWYVGPVPLDVICPWKCDAPPYSCLDLEIPIRKTLIVWPHGYCWHDFLAFLWILEDRTWVIWHLTVRSAPVALWRPPGGLSPRLPLTVCYSVADRVVLSHWGLPNICGGVSSARRSLSRMSLSSEPRLAFITRLLIGPHLVDSQDAWDFFSFAYAQHSTLLRKWLLSKHAHFNLHCLAHLSFCLRGHKRKTCTLISVLSEKNLERMNLLFQDLLWNKMSKRCLLTAKSRLLHFGATAFECVPCNLK